MGECEERLPGEIVEIYRAPRRLRETRDPREVVEVYRPRDAREVVEEYSRPAPQRRREPEPPAPLPPRKLRGKVGLEVFAILVGFMLLLAGMSRLVDRIYDPFPLRKGHASEFTGIAEEEEITIPGWPVGQGISLAVTQERSAELTAQEVYRQVNPAVVTVQCGTEDGLSIGTGVIFNEEGYVITNYHVVRGGRTCSVVLDSGLTMQVCYVAGDANSDLAVLKVPPGELQSIGTLPFADFGDSEQMVVGDTVYAIGSPRQLRGTLTNGIVSAISRDIKVEGRSMSLLQTNAALNSGNSGGPLINVRGQVIGINVAKFMSDRDSVEGLGFAIPSAQMERIVNDLLEWGEVQPEPRLGIMVVTDEWGLLVHSVEPGTAAGRAGVQAGDYIVAAAGEPVENNQDLFRIRRRLYVGDQLPLTLRRGGETLEVVLELDEAVS